MALRYALRTLAKTPGFTAIAILTLALGIGVTTTMFTVVNSVLFKPLPFPNPDRLHIALTNVRLPEGRDAGPNSHVEGFPNNARHISEWRANCQACEDVALVGGQGYTLTGVGAPERLAGLDVSYNFFRTVGVRPSIGRDFAPEDEGPAGFHVVLLSDALWRSRFGADRSIVGQSIQLNGEAHTVIGVMPPIVLPRGTEWVSFFPHNLAPALFRPTPLDIAAARPMGSFNFATVVRLKPGVMPARAAAELSAELAQFSRAAGLEISTTLTPLAERMTGGTKPRLWMLLAAVVAVLALVSLNIGSLLLVRSVSRSRDASIRIALGADRADLLWPMLAEVFVLVAAGGVLGGLLSVAAIRTFVATAPIDLPRIGELRPDLFLLAFAVLTSAVSAALASVAPAARLLREDLRSSLASATRSATESKSRLRVLDAMMIAEVALSTAVLIAGSLLATSLLNVLKAERGFDTEHVVTQVVPLTSPRYAATDERNAFVGRALEMFRVLPGVSLVGETTQLPLRGETWVDALVDADHPADKDGAPLTNRRFVSPGYIAAMGIQLKAGRDISEADRNRHVALMSERAARVLWPNENPIGRHVVRATMSTSEPPNQPADVIGLVADVKTADLEHEPPSMVYQPYWDVGPGGPAFVFRTDRDSASLAPDIRATVAKLDANLPVAPPESMQLIVSGSTAVRRFQTSLVGAFSLAALLIAAIGVYGLVSFTVARRTRELGLRVALGATAGNIISMVLRQGLRPVVIGGTTGFLAALVGGGLIAGELYHVTPHDVRALGVVALTLGAAAIAACAIPAWRASRVDPMIPLRAE